MTPRCSELRDAALGHVALGSVLVPAEGEAALLGARGEVKP